MTPQRPAAGEEVKTDVPQSTGLPAAVSGWLTRFEAALRARDIPALTAMFCDECYWRDLVAFTWNILTLEGRAAIGAMLSAQLDTIDPSEFVLDATPHMAQGTEEALFSFRTASAHGSGHLRLKDGRAFTLLTAITGLIGHEEQRGFTRPNGVVHGAHRDRRIWLEERAREAAELGYTRQPYCVIIGGGQGGLALAARLRQLKVPTLIVERNARPGDSWRNRYRSLVLHDPVWYDHLPYIPFPAHWPVFSPKDKIGDWLEMYARVMELNVWGSTEATRAVWDAGAGEWSLSVLRDGQEIVLSPKQLVFATGSYGPPREVVLPGSDRFTGDQYHSARHVSAAPWRGRRAVVVGANSSAHDIAADLWENEAAEVTLIQRSPTTVVRSETLMDVAFAELYSERAMQAGMTTDMADLLAASMPLRLMPGVQREMYREIKRRDADLIARLNAAGFRTDYGEDGSGLMMKALRTGSGYYIDVGASELIASGAVKVRSGVEPVGLRERSVVLSDGSEIAADLVVYATGYRPMTERVAQIVSREVADRIGPNWGYGSGVKGDPGPWLGELRNMWKPLAQDALWFHGGNLALSRFHSLHLALQLKARMEGIPVRVHA